jgi:hypothetical protein
MPQATVRIAATLATILLSGSLALAQQKPSTELVQDAVSLPATGPHQDWAKVSAIASSRKKIIIATLAQPTRRRTCRVQSFTAGQLVCKGSFGTTHIYKPQEIAALIIPGDNDIRIRFLLGFNSALGAAVWGTVVLAPVCIPCAVATGIAALIFFGAAGATCYGDGQSEALICSAPGQILQVQLH